MPELPEVTTTANGLQKVLPGLVIKDVWTDLAKSNKVLKQFKETIKNKDFYEKFRKEIIGKKVINSERRAKNILINVSGGYTILIHLKMTGHIIYGKYVYDKKTNKWTPDEKERAALHDPYNRFVHFVFSLSNGKHFVMCDSRKFGKITFGKTDEIHKSIHLGALGLEPLDKGFTFEKFKEQILKKPKGNIKTILMDQTLVVGIGNIYSDEMLWMASIHPESKPSNVPSKQFKLLYESMKEVLKKGIDFGGDSMSDYRDVNGERGKFQNHHNVYQKKAEPCGKRGCKGVIIRKVINGRSAHFCDTHQELF